MTRAKKVFIGIAVLFGGVYLLSQNYWKLYSDKTICRTVYHELMQQKFDFFTERTWQISQAELLDPKQKILTVSNDCVVISAETIRAHQKQFLSDDLAALTCVQEKISGLLLSKRAISHYSYDERHIMYIDNILTDIFTSEHQPKLEPAPKIVMTRAKYWQRYIDFFMYLIGLKSMSSTEVYTDKNGLNYVESLSSCISY